jgi:hypothetical protein
MRECGDRSQAANDGGQPSPRPGRKAEVFSSRRRGNGAWRAGRRPAPGRVPAGLLQGRNHVGADFDQLLLVVEGQQGDLLRIEDQSVSSRANGLDQDV